MLVVYTCRRLKRTGIEDEKTAVLPKIVKLLNWGRVFQKCFYTCRSLKRTGIEEYDSKNHQNIVVCGLQETKDILFGIWAFWLLFILAVGLSERELKMMPQKIIRMLWFADYKGLKIFQLEF